MKLPVLHVGFHKSGSTTLQEALFARHSGVANLGEPAEDPQALAAIQNAWESCCLDPAVRKTFDLARSRALWQAALAGVGAGKVAVFSKERLTRYGYCDETLPGKLRELVGQARIVIMTRNQIKLVESLFYSKTDGEVSAGEWLTSETAGRLNEDRFRIYRYHSVAQAYVEAFGRENVGVFLLEDLAKNTETFARQLCAFIGIDGEEGVRLLTGKRMHGRKSTRGLAYARIRNALLGPNIHLGQFVPAGAVDAFSAFLSRGRPVKVELPTEWVAELESYYRDENCRLAKEWGLPLEKYGYPM